MTAVRPAVLSNPIPLYVVGLFSMGYVDFYIFLMPLYCLSLGMSAGEIGLIVGHARHWPSFCRSISAC
jgi:hypothetical protein